MRHLRTQVGIVGGGPAGLLLGHLLHRAGLESVILERRSRAYVIERVRAGVLEQNTVDLFADVGLGSRLAREGLRHEGLYFRFDGRRHRIDLAEATGGRAITVYGQSEVVKDLIDARVASGAPLAFEVSDVALHDLDTARPSIRYRHDDEDHRLQCDVIAGCDGFHGISRATIPAASRQVLDHTYPYAWLGILAEAPPTSDELVYSLHERGFALFSMRTPSITRLYLQCAPDAQLDDWPDDRIWSELLTRLGTDDGWRPEVGRIAQKSITGMRSVVCEPMRYGRLFLAGDAAHIVPPTGAKGLNLAVADVWRLAGALVDFYTDHTTRALDDYSAWCLRRAWRAQRFSWWMTSMFHRADVTNAFEYRRQLAELDYVVHSRAATASLAENYVGLPLA